ncbi:hypothetical protein R3P38DRAFT_3244436 [Favolaschia claudopus]|uniref:Uncharacterized protein n=1 Tax=Favolaschia claudopus TaxID=2862362 RepID=A0AAV9Z206_9AGAR
MAMSPRFPTFAMTDVMDNISDYAADSSGLLDDNALEYSDIIKDLPSDVSLPFPFTSAQPHPDDSDISLHLKTRYPLRTSAPSSPADHPPSSPSSAESAFPHPSLLHSFEVILNSWRNNSRTDCIPCWSLVQSKSCAEWL